MVHVFQNSTESIWAYQCWLLLRLPQSLEALLCGDMQAGVFAGEIPATVRWRVFDAVLRLHDDASKFHQRSANAKL